jgi:hypothetical protein
VFLVLVALHSGANAEDRAFSDVGEFVATIANAEVRNASASGLLNETDAVYHAYLLQIEDYRTQQIFIFRTDSMGRLILVDVSKKMEYMGGTGRWEVSDIEFRNHSLFISFQSHWHECFERFTSQFRLRKGQLVLIGRESVEENTKKDLVVESSANLLTGMAYSVSGNQKAMYTGRASKSAPRKYRFKIPKGTQPFSEFDGAPWKSPIYRKRPVC